MSCYDYMKDWEELTPAQVFSLALFDDSLKDDAVLCEECGDKVSSKLLHRYSKTTVDRVRYFRHKRTEKVEIAFEGTIIDDSIQTLRLCEECYERKRLSQ